MKKTTKLLSVILAFVMALSCMSVMASAARTNYQTVENLEALGAYNNFGTVSRLTSEERMSILADSLDTLLASANINMGTVLDTLGLKITLDFRSIDLVCSSLDTLSSTTQNGLFSIAKGIVDLGIVEEVNFKSWQRGMTRDNTAQLNIVYELMEVLSTNTNLVNTILTSGLELGNIIKSFLPANLDFAGINALVTNLPGLISSIVLPKFGRPDDTQADRDKYSNANTDLVATAQEFLNGLMTKPMNWTSYRVDAAGNSLGFTMDLPTEASGTSRYFAVSADKKTITQYDYKYPSALGGDPAGFYETVTYTLDTKEEYTGSGSYLYRAPKDYSGDQTLKYYKADGKVDNNGRIQSAYLLPTVKAAMESGVTLNLNGSDTALGLLYKFIPYIFAEMAPTVLNGSAKKLIAEAFDVEFTKIGVKGDAEVAAVSAATGNPDNFFTRAQEYYTWEYSDYKVINGVPYYRFQDQYFVGEIPSNISAYYYMFNWGWNIGDDFLNEFIPAAADGSAYILDNLNAIIGKAIKAMLAPTFEVKGITYNRDEIFAWSNANGNGDLLNNILNAARNFFKLAPEEVLDEYYMEAQFFDAMMNGTLQQAVNGLVCELVKLIMPQIKFADSIVDMPITAILAVVVRELCTQLMPTYDFDAMIYTDYTAKERVMASHTADEWLDISLYMGVNLGMYYLRNIADIGEGTTNGYYEVMKNLGAFPSSGTADKAAFTATSYKASAGQASWMVAVDWIIDWALAPETDAEYGWHFVRLINNSVDVQMTTYENPWIKFNDVITTFLPAVTTLLNTDSFSGTAYGSNTFVEKLLKGGLVDSIVNLDVEALISAFHVPAESLLRQTNIADQLVNVIVNLLNNVFKKACGGKNLITGINSVAALLNHDNLKAVVINLVGNLYAATKTYGILEPILAIANLFIGWKIDPQEYSEPSINITNSWGSSYLYNASTSDNNAPTLKFINNASGMLLKHRNSNVVDKPYTIIINSIECSDGVTASYTAGTKVEPGKVADIALTVPNQNLTFQVIVKYSFLGKSSQNDSDVIGGEQTVVTYGYVSNVKDQLNEKVAGVDKKYTINSDYKSYEFTEDIYAAVTGYTATVSYKGAAVSIGAPKSCAPQEFTHNSQPTGVAAQYFEFYGKTEYAKAGFVTVYKDTTTTKPGSSTGHMYRAKAGVTAETEFPYGVYDMGNVAIKYNGSGKDYIVDFIYYNDDDIGDVVKKYIGYGIKAEDYASVAAAAYQKYETALRNAVALAYTAKRIDYVDTIQPQIPAAIEALETAYKELVAYGKTINTGDVADVKAKLDSIETNPDRDINFQDYALFEYFKYEAQRTAARKMIASVEGPSAPENYIDNVWGNDLTNAIINAQTNANVKAGINATVTEPTKEEKDAYEAELNAFVPAEYTLLKVEDQVAKLQYYHDFMKVMTKTVDKTFLQREITAANNQGYVAADYSADSWAAYTEALAQANAVNAKADAKESEIFDAKYELMLAQNKLVKKDRSMKEVGYMNEELIPLIKHAEAIIANYGTLYTVKAGVTQTDAFAQLVEALGIRYNVTVDGKDYEGILYDGSAVTFQDYDRIASKKNKLRVDVAADALREAITNFECTAKLESNNDATAVDQVVRYVTGIVPNSLKDVQDLKDKVTVTGATPVYAASKAGKYGTGTRVDLMVGEKLVSTYFVVIYGDVNGDGAVDAMDAIEVDLANHTAYYMGDVYNDAADVNGDGIVNQADYGELAKGVRCQGAISQTR